MLRSHTGWAIELEDFAALERLPNDDPIMAMRGQYEANRLDPREVLRVENQGSVGSCAGHSLSTIMEWCHCIATGHAELQLSRAMAYYWTQRIDGITGDRGSTIHGGTRLAKETGVCREQLWPYVARYNPQSPVPEADIKADAARFKIQTAVNLRSYEALRIFLESGQGGVHTGITWKQSMNSAVVEQFGGRGGGGHSTGWPCCSERTDRNGRPYIWGANSWGEQFGNGGWFEMSPMAIEQMLADRFTVFIGLSDLTTPEPRRIDWTLNSPWFA